MNECREVNEEGIGDQMGDDEVDVSSGDRDFQPLASLAAQPGPKSCDKG